MANSSWLTLIVPDIGVALTRAAQAEQSERIRQGRMQLARIAGRGSLRYAWDRRDLAAAALRPWQRGLLATLNLSAPGFPSAAVSANGSIARSIADTPADAPADTPAGILDGQRGKSWLHAEPVHFIAGLDRLNFLALEGEAQASSSELAALEPLLADHLRSLNCELHSIARTTQAPGADQAAPAWLIASDRICNADTVCPDAAAANELERAMPRGPDAGELRRLMTELQMLLHDHPVNEARARRGLPAINAVWLWGTGAIQSPQLPHPLPPAFGAEPYLTGIYELHGHSVAPLPGTCDQLLSDIADTQHAIAFIPAVEIDSLETQWIEPMTRALADGVIARVDLILDGWHVNISRASLRRFWRRPLPPWQWPAAESMEQSA